MQTDIDNAFADSFLLVAIRASRPSFAPKLSDVSVSVDGQPIADEMTRTNADLLPEALRKVLGKAFGHINNVISKYTISYSSLIPSIKILPKDKADEFFTEFDQVRQQFQEILENDFFPAYESDVLPAARSYWTSKLGPELYKKRFDYHLPPVSELRKRIGIKPVTISISYAVAEDSEQALIDVATNIREKMENAIAELKDQLTAGKKLSPRTFNKLQDAFVTVRGFKAFADAPLLAQLGKVEKQIDEITGQATLAADIKTGSMTDTIKSYSTSIIQGLDALMESCQSSAGIDQAIKSFGAAPRLIGKATE